MRIRNRTKFDSTEHRTLKVNLPGLEKLSREDKQPLFLMANDLALSFGDITALAGDYYAEEPISTAPSLKKQQAHFLRAYQSLNLAKRCEVRNLLQSMDKQARIIKETMERGKSERQAITSYALEESFKAILYTRGRYWRRGKINFDHFGDNAIKAHHAGHQLALQTAAEGFHLRDPKAKSEKLAQAYAYEAFACHFLVDRFATGHIRTPRLAFYKEFGPTAATILTLLMHAEENVLGLNVTTDGRTTVDKIFGDAHLLENYNQTINKILFKALEVLINEIHDAYTSGRVLSQDYSQAYRLIPTPIADNHPPMFFNDPQKMRLYYRADLKNPTCDTYLPLTRHKVACIVMEFVGDFAKDVVVELWKKCLPSHSLFAKKIKNNNDHPTLTLPKGSP